MVTLGKLIRLVQDFHESWPIRFHTKGNWDIIPTCLRSYRGYYDQLALGYDLSPTAYCTVGTLITELSDAIGKTFEGYKGGLYKMSTDTNVWVANWGSAEERVITGVKFKDSKSIVVIKTRVINP